MGLREEWLSPSKGLMGVVKCFVHLPRRWDNTVPQSSLGS